MSVFERSIETKKINKKKLTGIEDRCGPGCLAVIPSLPFPLVTMPLSHDKLTLLLNSCKYASSRESEVPEAEVLRGGHVGY